MKIRKPLVFLRLPEAVPRRCSASGLQVGNIDLNGLKYHLKLAISRYSRMDPAKSVEKSFSKY